MKYTINGFSQTKLLEFKMDLVDSLILRWFVDFRGTDKMVSCIYEGEIYYWVSYKGLIKDIPIIGITSKDVLRRRLKALCEKEILINYTQKTRKGSYSMYNLGLEYLELISNDKAENESYSHPTQKSYPPDSKVGCTPDLKVGPKDTSTKNKKTTNQTTTDQKSKEDIVNEINEKPVVVSDEEVILLKKEIDKDIGKIESKKLLNLIKNNGIDVCKMYLKNFNKFGGMKNPVGFYIKAIEELYCIPEDKAVKYKNGKLPQEMNFEQRKIDDDFDWDSLYDN